MDIASGEKVWSQSYPGSDVIWLSAGPDLSSISVFQYKNNVTRVDFINIKTQEEIHSLAFQGISDDISFHQDLMMQALASQGKVHLPASLEEVKNIFANKVPDGSYIPPIIAVSQDETLAAAYISGIELPGYHMSVQPQRTFPGNFLIGWGEMLQ